eukprot:s1975_g15.t1
MSIMSLTALEYRRDKVDCLPMRAPRAYPQTVDMPTLRRRQSSPLCVAVLLCVVAACDFVFGLNLLFTAPAAQVSIRRQTATSPSPVSLRAREVDEEEVLFNFNKKKKKGYDPNWERPFPRYIVGGGIFLTIVGFFGGQHLLRSGASAGRASGACSSLGRLQTVRSAVSTLRTMTNEG